MGRDGRLTRGDTEKNLGGSGKSRSGVWIGGVGCCGGEGNGRIRKVGDGSGERGAEGKCGGPKLICKRRIGLGRSGCTGERDVVEIVR